MKISAIAILACSLFFRANAQAQTNNQAFSESGTRPPTVSLKESKAHLLKAVPANYPPIANAAHVQGVVVLGIEVDKEGNVTTVVPLSGPEMLRATAMEAVKQYKYKPFLINGEPAVIRAPVQVRFVPGRSKSVE